MMYKTPTFAEPQQYNRPFSMYIVSSYIFFTRNKCLCRKPKYPEKTTDPRPAASRWQTLSHNVVSSTHRLNEIRTRIVSGDRYKHMYVNPTIIRSRPRQPPANYVHV